MLPPTERTSVIQLVRLDLLYGLLFSPERDDPARVVGYSLALPDVGFVLCVRLVQTDMYSRAVYISTS
jgi:hypothetical protein